MGKFFLSVLGKGECVNIHKSALGDSEELRESIFLVLRQQCGQGKFCNEMGKRNETIYFCDKTVLSREK